MALNLNDEKAIDYSSDIPYFPFDTYGTFDFVVLAWDESSGAGSEQNKSDKEFDVITVEVLASDNPVVKVGEKLIFWFQTGGDGVNQKNRAYKAAELRQPVSAAMGVNPTSAEYKKYDAVAGRKELLARDFSAVETGLRLKACRGDETKKFKEARKTDPAATPAFYTDKFWSVLAA